MKDNYILSQLPLNIDLESTAILKQLTRSSRLLAELKGAANKIPNKEILIASLSLMEAKESSSVENIVTTHDELYKADLNSQNYITSSATKEVMNYRQAIMGGFTLVKQHKLLTNATILSIQEVLENNKAGFRSLPGTTLKDSKGNIVYTPPQDKATIQELMSNLEDFINRDELSDLDPLIKMAIIHYQFESIHPFYDGNGRTGRIICILYLVSQQLLDLPILYLSRYITHNKSEYYRLLQAIRANNNHQSNWQEWVLFMLKGVEDTARNTLFLVKGIEQLMGEYKQKLRPAFGHIYKHELLNNLFFHPYTKIEYMQRDLQVERQTATKYLEMIVELKLLDKVKAGRTNYFINTKLVDLLVNHQYNISDNTLSIE